MVSEGTVTVRSGNKGFLASPAKHKQGYWSKEQCALPAEESRLWPDNTAGPLEMLLQPESCTAS